ncbi:unnamed protein product [Lampetra fluviatilis]
MDTNLSSMPGMLTWGRLPQGPPIRPRGMARNSHGAGVARQVTASSRATKRTRGGRGGQARDAGGEQRRSSRAERKPRGAGDSAAKRGTAGSQAAARMPNGGRSRQETWSGSGASNNKNRRCKKIKQMIVVDG